MQHQRNKEVGDNIQFKTEQTVLPKKTTMIVVQGKKVSNISKSQRSEKCVNSTISKNERTVLLKEVFQQEILEIEQYLYVQMSNLEKRREAIIAWDRLENLMNKNVKDAYAFKRMVDLLWRLRKSEVLVDGVNREKVACLIKKYY